MKKIELKDVSNWLKLCLIGGGISLVIWTISFLVGLIEGILLL